MSTQSCGKSSGKDDNAQATKVTYNVGKATWEIFCKCETVRCAGCYHLGLCCGARYVDASMAAARGRAVSKRRRTTPNPLPRPRKAPPPTHLGRILNSERTNKSGTANPTAFANMEISCLAHSTVWLMASEVS